MQITYPRKRKRRELAKIAGLAILARHASASPASDSRSKPGMRASNALELASALSEVNRHGGNATILLSAGIYRLTRTLIVSAPNVTLKSVSGQAADVVIAGDAMSPTARVGNLIRVDAPGFALSGLTLERSGRHLIQVAGESNADDFFMSHCILRDAFEQMIKVSVDTSRAHVTADRGVVEDCLFEYTAGIGPQFYIGGIDAHGAKQWIVRKNLFRNIASPSKAVAEFAIHFWADSADNLVEGNFIVDCDRGIGFGLDGKQNHRGIIRNNIVFHTSNGHPFADVGIALLESAGTTVHNNTILLEHQYPWAIEYRFRSTNDVKILNNLSNRPIIARDGASAWLKANFTRAYRRMFELDLRGVPRLRAPVKGMRREGLPISGFTEDFFGNPRPNGTIDIGAEEWLGPTK